MSSSGRSDVILCTSFSAETCRLRLASPARRPLPFESRAAYSLSSTMAVWISPSRSISVNPSFAVRAPMKEIPNGLSSARAAEFSPLSSSRRINGSSLMTSTLETGFAIECGVDGWGEGALYAAIARQMQVGGTPRVRPDGIRGVKSVVAGVRPERIDVVRAKKSGRFPPALLPGLAPGTSCYRLAALHRVRPGAPRFGSNHRLGHCLDGGSEAALVARGCVLVHDLLVGNRVDHLGRLAQCV